MIETNQLLKTFAERNKLKITRDECDDAIISGKQGHIYEYGSGKVGICIMSRSGNVYRWNKFRRAFQEAGMEITQNGEYEGCAIFDPENDDQVALAIRCAGIKRKRQVRTETRDVMIANLAMARQVRSSISLA